MEHEELTPGAVAKLLRITEGTLRNWRSQGLGPPYLKLGAGVVYRRADVLAWIEAQRVIPAGRK
jgi:DNA-binding transcriptional MerR regulator